MKIPGEQRPGADWGRGRWGGSSLHTSTVHLFRKAVSGLHPFIINSKNRDDNCYWVDLISKTFQ